MAAHISLGQTEVSASICVPVSFTGKSTRIPVFQSSLNRIQKLKGILAFEKPLTLLVMTKTGCCLGF